MSLNFIKSLASKESNLALYLKKKIEPRSNLSRLKDKLTIKKTELLNKCLEDNKEHDWAEYHKLDEIQLINQPDFSLSWHISSDFNIAGIKYVCEFCDDNRIKRPDAFIFTDNTITSEAFMAYNESKFHLTKSELLGSLDLKLAPWVSSEISSSVTSKMMQDAVYCGFTTLDGFSGIPVISISIADFELCDLIFSDYKEDARFDFISKGGRYSISPVFEPGFAWITHQLKELRCNYLIADESLKSSSMNPELFVAFDSLATGAGAAVVLTALDDIHQNDCDGEEIAPMTIYKVS